MELIRSVLKDRNSTAENEMKILKEVLISSWQTVLE